MTEEIEKATKNANGWELFAATLVISVVVAFVVFWGFSAYLDNRVKSLLEQEERKDQIHALITEVGNAVPEEWSASGPGDDQIATVVTVLATSANWWGFKRAITPPWNANTFPSNQELLESLLKEVWGRQEQRPQQSLCRSIPERSDECLKSLSNKVDAVMVDVRESPIYLTRRVFMGSIQFLTFWFFVAGLTYMSISLYRQHRVEERCAERLSLREFKGMSSDSGYGLRRKKAGPWARLVPQATSTRIFANFESSLKASRSMIEAQQVLNGEVAQWREDLSSSGAFVTFCLFAMPSVGFVGTVLGISDALGGADRVVSSEYNALQISSIQEMTARLALAFDTTLVALLLLVPLTAVWTMLQRQRDALVTRFHDRAVRAGLDWSKSSAAPAEGRELEVLRKEVESAVDQKVAAITENLIAMMRKSLEDATSSMESRLRQPLNEKGRKEPNP